MCNRPFAWSGHKVPNHTYWWASCTVELPKQSNSYQSTLTCLCFWSHTAICVPACVILYHVIGSCKGPIDVQICGLYAEGLCSWEALPRNRTEQATACPAQFCSVSKCPLPLLSWLAYWAWAVGYLCLNYRSVNGVPLSFQAIKEKKACKRSFFSFGKLFKLVLLLLVAAIAIDIYKHKGYKGTMLLVSFLFCAFLTSLWLMLFCTFESCQEFKSSVFFLLKASKTAQIAKDYGIEQAVLTGYGQAKNGFDAANR